MTASSSTASNISEQQGHHGVNTFTNYHNASGMGPRVDPGAWVDVSCKVYDPYIASVNPDGYWYRIASPPWNDQYYAPANTFMNGDPWDGPYSHNTDFAVPDCGAAVPPQPPASVSLTQGDPSPSRGYYYNIGLHSFAAGSVVSVTCSDSVDPGGFRTFTMAVDGAGNGASSRSCYSADGPDHWVVANGSVASNHVAWQASPSGTTGSGTGPSGGSSGTGGNSSGSGSSSQSGPTGKYRNPCIARFPGGVTRDRSIFGGIEVNYDRVSSMYQQCSGFGMDGTGLKISPEFMCGMIAAAAGYVTTPTVNGAIDKVCDYGGFAGSIAQGNWAGGVGGHACSVFGDAFATGAGVLLAGASSETGPGAVAVGVASYKALAAFFDVSCSSFGQAYNLGYWLESRHEYHVAMDILREGKCLQSRTVFGYLKWSAVDC